MPVVKVWCLPQVLGGKQFARVLKEYRIQIIDSVLSVSGLGLKEKHEVAVVFPIDLLTHNDAETIVVEISGLNKKPKLTLAVRNRLAETVGRTVQTFYPKTFVECFTTGFSSKQGFWSPDQKNVT